MPFNSNERFKLYELVGGSTGPRYRLSQISAQFFQAERFKHMIRVLQEAFRNQKHEKVFFSLAEESASCPLRLCVRFYATDGCDSW